MIISYSAEYQQVCRPLERHNRWLFVCLQYQEAGIDVEEYEEEAADEEAADEETAEEVPQ